MIKTLRSKPRIAIILIICVLFITYNVLNAIPKPILPDDEFAFSPTPQNGQAGGIEGVYYHRASSLMEILDELSCKSEGWDDCTTYQLLRFYDDGVVLDTPIGSDDGIDDGDLQKLQKWFNRDTKEMPNGQYFVSGSRVWFSTSIFYDDFDKPVTSDFSGFILGNILVLDEYSHYNGNKLSKMIFIKLNDDSQNKSGLTQHSQEQHFQEHP